jgi:hypothetical protein
LQAPAAATTAGKPPQSFQTLDPDGNKIYGSAGVVISQLAPGDVPGNAGYTQIDSPGGSGTITSGVACFPSVFTGQVLDYASLQFTAAENYVLGICTDHTDLPAFRLQR